MIEIGVLRQIASHLHGMRRWVLVIIAVFLSWLAVPQVAAGTWSCSDDCAAPVYAAALVPSTVEVYLSEYLEQGPPAQGVAKVGVSDLIRNSYDASGHLLVIVCVADPTISYTYDAFGILIASTGSTFNRFLYCGEEWDANLNLYYNRARWMEPGRGRFWSMDTYGGQQEDPASLHKYNYTQSDPIDGIDPSGFTVWNSNQKLGYEAEDVIENIYAEDHPLDEVKYGRWTRLVGGIGLYRLKPDIFNYKPVRMPKRYAEIKPLSPSGIVAGGLQMYARSLQFGPLGFKPDAMWRPSTNVGTTISGTKIVFFNDGGLIFYFDITADIEDLLIVAAGRPALIAAINTFLNTTIDGLTTQLPRLISLVKTSEQAEYEVDNAEAELLLKANKNE